MKTIKLIRAVDYKGEGNLKAGSTVEIDDTIADRLIADGHAVEAEAKPAKKGKATDEA